MRRDDGTKVEDLNKVEKMKRMIDDYVELELKNMKVEFEDELKRFARDEEKKSEARIEELKMMYRKKMDVLERRRKLRIERLRNMTKSRLMNNILENLMRRLKEHIVGLMGSERAKLIERMFHEAVDEFGEGEYIVETMREDIETLRNLTDAEIVEGKKFGVILKSKDGRYRVVNTVDEFIERKKGEIYECMIEKLEGIL
ncbi:MAG: V-type ATP synthase subunit E [Thermotogae bacterium]|nr:V-type ATP synthase subunit E [Thermotogota bacterium]